MILKTITIPDLHGKDVWKQINPNKYDKIIFIGDYMDAPYRSIADVSFSDGLNDRVMIDGATGKSSVELLYNLLEIIEFKDNYPDKVILLIGNHDIPYILYIRNKSLYNKVMCSGHRYSIAPVAAKMFNDHFDKFKIMYQLGDVVWSHAGLTQEAYDYYFKLKMDRYDILVEEMNKLFIFNDMDLYRVPQLRGGEWEHGSITWADKREWNMKTYKLPFHQIVGHTPVKDIEIVYSENAFIQPPREIVFTDVLHVQTKFYERYVEI